MKKSLCFVLIALMLSGCGLLEKNGPGTDTPGDAAQLGTDAPVSRALAAKMTAFALFSPDDIADAHGPSPFADVPEEAWYGPYVNILYEKGVVAGDGGMFRPEDYLTLDEAKSLIKKMAPESGINVSAKDGSGGKALSLALWTALFRKAVDTLEAKNAVYEAQVSVFAAVPEPETGGQFVATDAGLLGGSGLSVGGYVDTRLSVLVKDGEILSLLERVSDGITAENAYLAASGQELSVYFGGAFRKFKYTGHLASPIGTLKISKGGIEDISFAGEKITGEVKKTGAALEIQSAGTFHIAEGARFYKGYGEAAEVGKGGILPGGDEWVFFARDGKICGGIMEKAQYPQTVRVLLSTTDYGGYVHNGVTLAGGFALEYAGGKKAVPEGEEFTLTAGSQYFASGNRVYITPAGDKITVLSITRRAGNPSYRGTLEIEKREEGLVIVNEVPLEEYLYSVIPSEMYTAYGVEAAKVQAVCARSYAYNQFYAGSYGEWGANVDDSVKCQVYNNEFENENSIAAVEATQGLCLTYGSKVINANFFSTSAGCTANAGEVWSDSATREFPADTPPYLASVKQYSDADFGDLSSEGNAEAFFKTVDIESYDREFSWFRWNVRMTAAELSASVNAALAESAKDGAPLVCAPSGEAAPESLGRLKDIAVMGRGEGGNVTEIRLSGESSEVTVKTEYLIRKFLAPKSAAGGSPIVINCHDGSRITDYSIMPSTFFVMNKEYENGELAAVTFYGGGNGHGVGLSQNGVKGMLDAGYSFDEILMHYYSGASVTRVLS